MGDWLWHCFCVGRGCPLAGAATAATPLWPSSEGRPDLGKPHERPFHPSLPLCFHTQLGDGPRLSLSAGNTLCAGCPMGWEEVVPSLACICLGTLRHEGGQHIARALLNKKSSSILGVRPRGSSARCPGKQFLHTRSLHLDGNSVR